MILNEALLIVTANRSFYDFFKVTEDQTRGRPVYELGNGQWNITALRDLLKVALADNQTFDNFLVEYDFPYIGHRKLLLNARNIINNNHLSESKLILLAMNEVS